MDLDQNGAVLAAIAVTVAVAAAVRSTWSPCGLSMLSSITPISERAKGHRYATTCAWFVLGALLGGLTLGAGIAVLAAVVAAVDPSHALTLLLGAAALLLAAASDAPRGFTLPFHRRQVNEDWLDAFRPWLYAGGFGWQIGVGFATYIMTAGLYALVVVGALSANPLVALALGAAFGLVRGLAVLVSRRVRTPAELLELHARFDRAEAPVRDAVVLVLLVAGCVAAAAWWPPSLLLIASGVVATRINQRRRRPLRHATA